MERKASSSHEFHHRPMASIPSKDITENSLSRFSCLPHITLIRLMHANTRIFVVVVVTKIHDREIGRAASPVK